MSKKWIWLPDWASDLSLWEDDLTDADASADHVFVPYETMAANLGDVYAIDGMSKAETVVGWGLGAFLLMISAAKRPKAQKWILLSPFADFCDSDGPWNSENILFKAREMHDSKEVALNAFKDQFGEEFSDWPDEWIDAARKMDPARLADGLRFLAQNRINRVVENSEKKLLKSMTLFDVYESNKLEAGKKSYAISMILQDNEKTLNDKQIDAIMSKIIKNLETELGAKLR